MSTEALPNLEPRIANLEGTITQIDKRLTSLETRVEAGFTDIALVQVGDELQQRFLDEAAEGLLERLRALAP